MDDCDPKLAKNTSKSRAGKSPGVVNLSQALTVPTDTQPYPKPPGVMMVSFAAAISRTIAVSVAAVMTVGTAMVAPVAL